MIEFIDIQKTYGAGTIHEIKALEPLNLKIMDGEFVVLIGSNGSGKSTLFNLLAGSTQPDKGQILINKTDISHLPEHQRCLYLSRIFQDPLSGTASELSILDNFRLAALRTRKKTLKIGTSQIFRKIIKDRIAGLNLGLESKIDQPVGTLSGGQRQALTLLMAVMDRSQILLMDEPTAALDPGTSRVIMEIADRIIREEGLTAILITHQVKDVLRYGERLIQMKEGKIVRDLNKTQKQGIQLNEVLGWFGE